MPKSTHENGVRKDTICPAGRCTIDEKQEERAVTHIDSSSPQSTLFSTNHFSHPVILQHDKNRMWQSVVRYQAIERGLKDVPISKEQIRSVLSKPFPDGVCCHHYSDGLGTLWSAIYDLTAGQVEICLGSPVHNKWRSFDLSGKEGITEYPVLFIDEAQADPASFYRRLEPGSEK